MARDSSYPSCVEEEGAIPTAAQGTSTSTSTSRRLDDAPPAEEATAIATVTGSEIVKVNHDVVDAEGETCSARRGDGDCTAQAKGNETHRGEHRHQMGLLGARETETGSGSGSANRRTSNGGGGGGGGDPQLRLGEEASERGTDPSPPAVDLRRRRRRRCTASGPRKG